MLPKILSWLRTIFSLEKWTEGIFSGKALLTAVALVVLVIGLWRSAIQLLEKPKRKVIAALSIIIVMFAAGIMVGNMIINEGLTIQTDHLNQEEAVIRLIQSSASQPVYAAEKEELYQRRFGGFSNHIFSTEELHRQPQGTIITNSSVEALGILRVKGRYTHLSPDSGV